MRLIIALTIIALISPKGMITEEIYNQIINSNVTWNPYLLNENPFLMYDEFEMKDFLGLDSLTENIKSINFDDSRRDKRILKKSAKNDFDNYSLLTTWKYIDYISNQVKCGGSWAFAAIDVLSDRLCILTENQSICRLSVHNLLTCSSLNNGCKGGRTISTLFHLKQYGVCNEICQKIRFNRLDHSCQTFCNFHNNNYKKIKIDPFVKTFSPRKTDETFKDIKNEMFEHGPLYAEMEVYEDFFYYKSGVYKNVSKRLVGYHAVRVVGWGKCSETGENYWIVANSWGKKWGEDGYFRIDVKSCQISNHMFSFSVDNSSIN